MLAFRMTLSPPRLLPLAGALLTALVLGCSEKSEAVTGKDADGAEPPKSTAPPAPDKPNEDAPKAPAAPKAGADVLSEDTPSRVHAAWKRKLTAANDALAKNPKDAAAHTAKAALYFERGAYKAALEEADKALALDPKSAEALRVRGNSYKRLGEPEKAKADLERAIELQPKNGLIVSSYAAYHRDTKNPALALTEARRAVELEPKSASTHYILGTVLNRAEQYDKALASFDEAIRLDPSYKFPYYSRAQASIQLGKYSSALSDLDTFVALAPSHPDGYQLRRSIYAKAGFTISAYHNETMSRTLTDSSKIKKLLNLVTLEVGMKELNQRFPNDFPPPVAGREDWTLADTALWRCIEDETPISYQIALARLAEGADVNRVDTKTGDTVLHVCMKKNAPALVVRLLLRNGASPTIKNKDGATPADILRKQMLDALPGVEPAALREEVKKIANGLNDKTFATVVENSFEPKIQRFLTKADDQWAEIKKEKAEYDKFRAKMDDLGQGMIAMMGRSYGPLDGVDPKEVGRVAAQLNDGIPEFKSSAAEVMVTSLDAALWNARLCYGRDDPRYLAVVKRAREIVSKKAK